MQIDNFTATVTHHSIKKIYGLQMIIFNIIFLFPAIIILGIIFGIYYSFQVALFLYMSSICSISRYLYNKNTDRNYIYKLERLTLNKKQKAIKWFIEYFFMFIQVLFFSYLGVLIFSAFAVPGGIFHNMLFNGSNQQGMYLWKFGFARFAVIVFSYYTIYILISTLIWNLTKGNEKLFFFISLTSILFSLCFQDALNSPFRSYISVEDPSIPWDEAKTAFIMREGKEWFAMIDVPVLNVFVFLNPQTHLNHLLGTEMYASFFQVNDDGSYLVKINEQLHYSTLRLSPDWRYNFGLIYPFVLDVLVASLVIYFAAID